jgi:arsenate reductase
LTEQGVEYESVNYLEHPLSEKELKKLLQRAGLAPQDVLRMKEPAYREFVAGKNLGEEELLGIIAAHPELLQRPFVIHKDRDKAVLARPIENLKKLGIK